jgi:hypothetical protein
MTARDEVFPLPVGPLLLGSLLAASLLVGLTAVAAADEQLHIAAGDLPGLVWALGRGDCTGSDLQRRQCRGVKAARATALRGKSFVVAGDDGAIEPGSDGRPVVRGCIACVAPVGGMYVVTRGSVSVVKGKVVGPVVGRGPKGCNPAAAQVDLTFRLDPAARWSQGGKSGVFVELAGVTVSCDAIAEPQAPPTPPPPERVTLDPTEIRTAMSIVEPEALRCFDRYGVPGVADAWMEIAASGAPTFVEVRGKFFDTPTGACVSAAVKKVRFPPFQRAPLRLHYPFNLR